MEECGSATRPLFKEPVGNSSDEMNRFAFIGEPSMSIEIDPVVGKSQYNLSSLPSVSDIIREFLAFKIRRMTYPNKEKVRIPMAVGPPLISQKVKEQIRENILKWQSK